MIKLLDLCCKAGGCSVGYYQAAQKLGLQIQITGVDKEPQPNYPFNFIQDDALNYLQNNHQYFTHVHASPPCQHYSQSTAVAKKQGKKYNDVLLPSLQQLMYSINKPGVIENVLAAPLRNDLRLYGYMFGLKVVRGRKFELVNWFCMQPGKPNKMGSVKNGDFAQCVGNGQKKVTNGKPFKSDNKTILEQWKEAMQIDWMKTNHELKEAIPPAYTKYIGEQWFNQL